MRIAPYILIKSESQALTQKKMAQNFVKDFVNFGGASHGGFYQEKKPKGARSALTVIFFCSMEFDFFAETGYRKFPVRMASSTSLLYLDA
jgi:hypothetical protein